MCFCGFRLRLHCKRNKLVRELEENVRLATMLHTQLKRFVLLVELIKDNQHVFKVYDYEGRMMEESAEVRLKFQFPQFFFKIKAQDRSQALNMLNLMGRNNRKYIKVR